jgi:hypothetical protein
MRSAAPASNRNAKLVPRIHPNPAALARVALSISVRDVSVAGQCWFISITTGTRRRSGRENRPLNGESNRPAITVPFSVRPRQPQEQRSRIPKPLTSSRYDYQGLSPKRQALIAGFKGAAICESIHAGRCFYGSAKAPKPDDRPRPNVIGFAVSFLVIFCKRSQCLFHAAVRR